MNCPKCGVPMVPDRVPVVGREQYYVDSGVRKCPLCHVRLRPADVEDNERVCVDLKERIALLEGLQVDLVGRLMAVSLPNEQIEQAVRLEKLAEEIFDKAQRIRTQLKEDTEGVLLLRNTHEKNRLEIAACRQALAVGMRLTKSMLCDIVEMLFNRKG